MEINDEIKYRGLYYIIVNILIYGIIGLYFTVFLFYFIIEY